MGSGTNVRGLWLEWPWADLSVPLILLVTWLMLGAPVPPDAQRGAFYTATSAAAGIGLAGAAFVCTMFYQASNAVLEEVRARFGPLIRRNWVWILSSLLGAVVAPVGAIVVDALSKEWAVGLAGTAGVLFIMSFGRVIYWFHRTLGVVDSPAAQEVEVKFRDPRN